MGASGWSYVVPNDADLNTARRDLQARALRDEDYYYDERPTSVAELWRLLSQTDLGETAPTRSSTSTASSPPATTTTRARSETATARTPAAPRSHRTTQTGSRRPLRRSRWLVSRSACPVWTDTAGIRRRRQVRAGLPVRGHCHHSPVSGSKRNWEPAERSGSARRSTAYRTTSSRSPKEVSSRPPAKHLIVRCPPQSPPPASETAERPPPHHRPAPDGSH
jgi:hypothetical protein